eukprot:18038-Heterococcus_DN1.PRE.2
MAAAPTAQLRTLLMLAHPISQVCTMMPLQILKKLVLLLVRALRNNFVTMRTALNHDFTGKRY